MKFNISENVQGYAEPQIGDVFAAKGGNWQGTKLWLVVAKKPPNTIVCLGLNREGCIVGAAHYNAHAMEGRAPVGRVEGLEELAFDVEAVP